MKFNYNNIDGFDVSFYQDDNSTPQGLDFNEMKGWGAEFVIIRAGQHTKVDSDFVRNWQDAKTAGIKRACYWFFDPRVTGKEQGKIYCDLVASDPPEGRMWVDLEFPDSWGGNYTNWTHWKEMCDYILGRGYRVGIYTGSWWWNVKAPNTSLTYFKQFPLWEANYQENPSNVTVSKGWETCLIWQKGTPPIGGDTGVDSIEIDYNWFNGDVGDFEKEFGVLTSPPITPPVIPPVVPPTNEGGSMKGTMFNFSVNYRDANSNILGQLKVNDVVYGDLQTTNRQRIYFSKIYRANGTIVNLNQVCNAVTDDGASVPVKYMKLDNISEPVTPPVVDPPVTPPTGTTVTHTIKINSVGQVSLDGQPYE